MKFDVSITYETNAETIDEGIEKVEAIINAIGFKNFKVTHSPDRRSLNQNNALHKYFELVEQEAENMGATMDMLVKKPNELPITRHLLKDMFRLIGKTMYGRKSTAELKKDEFSKVLETYQKIIAERLNISLPFPCMDTLEDNLYKN
jgi:hypothetical protein